MDKLTSSLADIESQISAKEEERNVVDGQILKYRTESVQLQERLIREGNAISVEELNKQKELLSALKEKDYKLKLQLRDMLDIAPFAISGQLFTHLKDQVVAEKVSKPRSPIVSQSMIL